MIQCTHYAASLYVTGVLKLFQGMEIKNHCFVGFCVKCKIIIGLLFRQKWNKSVLINNVLFVFFKKFFFLFIAFHHHFLHIYMYTLLFQHNIETFVIEFQIKFDMLFKGINIEYIATYPVVMKYHPVPSRRGNGPITHGVSFLNLEFVLPHKIRIK